MTVYRVFLWFIAATRVAAAQGPVSAVDGDGDTVRLPRPATRIVSLVPDATELVIALGATPQLIGRTQFDAEPELARVPSMGSMITPDLERIRALNPELVIVGTGEKRSATRAMLRQMGLTLYVAPIRDTSAFFQSARALGALTGKDSAATAMLAQIRATLASVHAAAASQRAPAAVFVMIGDPPTSVGPGTYLAQLIAVAGGRNIFDDATVDWPKVSIEQIVTRAPDIVLVAARDSTAIFRRLREAPGWRALEAGRRGRIVSVPADLVERPGPRMAELARLFQRAFSASDNRSSIRSVEAATDRPTPPN